MAMSHMEFIQTKEAYHLIRSMTELSNQGHRTDNSGDDSR